MLSCQRLMRPSPLNVTQVSDANGKRGTYLLFEVTRRHTITTQLEGILPLYYSFVSNQHLERLFYSIVIGRLVFKRTKSTILQPNHATFSGITPTLAECVILETFISPATKQ